MKLIVKHLKRRRPGPDPECRTTGSRSLQWYRDSGSRGPAPRVKPGTTKVIQFRGLFLWATLLLILGVTMAGSVDARTADFKQPVDVRADRSEYDEKRGIQTLSGNVEITQGSMSIKADKIIVKLKNNKLDTIDGRGSPIYFEQQNDQGELVTGQCDRILYDAENGRLTLSGNATLTEPKQTLRSEKIQFDSITQTVIAEGGNSGRVRIVIQPPEQK